MRLARNHPVGSVEPFGDDKPVDDQTFKFLVRSSEGERWRWCCARRSCRRT
ncbi:MAG: hypothetical protein R3C45_12915 [Phycisphaerales bacterium]